jgi:hypothetical protein
MEMMGMIETTTVIALFGSISDIIINTIVTSIY